MSALTVLEASIIGAGGLVFLLFWQSLYTVSQGNVAVITSFGKYVRSASPGVHFKNPFTEQIFKRISIQNKAIEIEFTAITEDQANVDFKAMLLYSTLDGSEDTIKKVAFKFIDEANFMQALIRSVEGSIRAFVARKKQNEILGVREEIVQEVKQHLDARLASWGYCLIDLQINDILFDEAVMRSMAQVVASENLKLAALNEGEAVLIKETKRAESQKISTILKSEGIAKREEILSIERVKVAERLKNANLDYSIMQLTSWVEAMKYIAEHGSGNTLFFDAGPEGLDKYAKRIQSQQPHA
ncbi:MAG: SPFH domain-containing protein [Vampirovibrio sp.]|jgi:regulator of protease activity HflC (stomatin/prohibitin superfamily)